MTLVGVRKSVELRIESRMAIAAELEQASVPTWEF